MEENYKNIEQNDEIDLMELLRKLLKVRKSVYKWIGISAVLGIILSIGMVKEYTASATLAPEFASRSSSSASALASLAGVSLGPSTSDAVYPEVYPSIVQSTEFLTGLFSTPVSFVNKKKEKIECDYYTYIKEYNKRAWYSVVMSLPGKAISWFIGLFKEKKEKIEGYENLNPGILTPEQYLICKNISNNISISIDKKNYMINITTTAQNSSVAYQVTQVVVQRLKDYVTSYRTEKTRQDVIFYSQLFEKAKADYYAAQKEYAEYVDANQGVAFRSVQIEAERLANEMNLKYSLYNSSAQNLQNSEARLQQERPVFAIVNPPTQPLRSSSTSSLMIVLVVAFLGFCCACVWYLFVKDKIAEFKAN